VKSVALKRCEDGERFSVSAVIGDYIEKHRVELEREAHTGRGIIADSKYGLLPPPTLPEIIKACADAQARTDPEKILSPSATEATFGFRMPSESGKRGKNSHAVALGKIGGAARMANLSNLSEEERLAFHSAGGKAGGKARSAKLSADQRKAIARKAGLASAEARRNSQRRSSSLAQP